MDVFTGVVLVVPCAVLAAVLYLFHKQSKVVQQTRTDLEKIERLLLVKIEEIHVGDAPAPRDVEEIPPEVDVVGAWALERARHGDPPSDREIDIQRKMWAEEGAF